MAPKSQEYLKISLLFTQQRFAVALKRRLLLVDSRREIGSSWGTNTY